jgi:hypothetical protein
MKSAKDAKEHIDVILRHVQYKPGTSFRTFIRYEGIDVIFEAEVPDSSYTDHKTKVQVYRHIDPWQFENISMEFVYNVVISLVREFELHEMEEWLKFGKNHMIDPHPELK